MMLSQAWSSLLNWGKDSAFLKSFGRQYQIRAASLRNDLSPYLVLSTCGILAWFLHEEYLYVEVAISIGRERMHNFKSNRFRPYIRCYKEIVTMLNGSVQVSELPEPEQFQMQILEATMTWKTRMTFEMRLCNQVSQESSWPWEAKLSHIDEWFPNSDRY